MEAAVWTETAPDTAKHICTDCTDRGHRSKGRVCVAWLRVWGAGKLRGLQGPAHSLSGREQLKGARKSDMIPLAPQKVLPGSTADVKWRPQAIEKWLRVLTWCRSRASVPQGRAWFLTLGAAITGTTKTVGLNNRNWQPAVWNQGVGRVGSFWKL